MKKKKLYTVDYTNPSGTIRLGEFDVPLPAMPPQKDMINYGLKPEKQFFVRTEIPKSLLKRKKTLTTEEEQFIADEYHRRENGVWMLIHGKPVYLTGPYYHFLNYWYTKNGVHPDFHYAQCLIYLFWDMVVRDTSCYGMFLIKPRRIGGTELTLHIEYEYATRVRNVHCGMQSKNEDSVATNYKRLTKSHKNMIWFMKPIHKGSDDPDGGLDFKYPMEMLTAKKLRELAESGEEADNAYSEDELGSNISYQPSVAVAYDGEELNRFILNEFGKMEKMSALDCWDKVKPCLHYDNGVFIVGKAMFESTIEEINDEQIEEMTILWDQSNAAKRDANGRTSSGLYRLFLSALDCANRDKWGFPRSEEARQFLENQFSELKKTGNLKKLASEKRKTPLTVEDALTPSGNQSAFNREHLQDIHNRLVFPEDPDTTFATRGNFIWDGAHDTKVLFDQNPDGKFLVSQLLKDGSDNAQVVWGGIRYPGNTHKYRGGVDPYEHEEVSDKYKASDGGGVIMRLYDDMVDGAKLENGVPIDYGWDWEANCPVCTYKSRPDDPDEFFEDMLMMHVYYGTQMLVESNKGAIKKYFRKRGYEQYVMLRPQETITENSRAKALSGIAATTDTIQQYFMAIGHYIMHYHNAIKHVDLIVDLMEMNHKNRTKHDLGVAFGWALIACEKKYGRNPALEAASADEAPKWFDYNDI